MILGQRRTQSDTNTDPGIRLHPGGLQHKARVMPLHEGWLLPQLQFTYKCS